MERAVLLHDVLRGGAKTAVAEVIEALAVAAAGLARTIAAGDLAGDLGRTGEQSAGGDVQKALDERAHRLFREALDGRGIVAFASEEAEAVECLDPQGSLCVAIDPIDGSGNIDVNGAMGTIFSILAAPADGGAPGAGHIPFAWPAGSAQLAAGFFLYGAQTVFVLTTGETVDIFALHGPTDQFRLIRAAVRMPDATVHDYAINGSNYRHWEEPVRAFLDECIAGANGHHGRDFNTRWHGAVVAEAYRILGRGGIYLYPGDAREGYRDGRLRLIYEGYPIALLVECAGGAASTGRRRILDLEATSPHQRVPLIFGTKSMVERVESFHHRINLWPPSAPPLFASRGLFRR